jgi:hypothetical protein
MKTGKNLIGGWFSQTPADNFDYVDKRFVHAKYDEHALANLKSIHEQLVEQGKKPSGFVIFDDCLFGQQWRSEEFCSLITQLRHYGITCIISCQYPQAINPHCFAVTHFRWPSST